MSLYRDSDCIGKQTFASKHEAQSALSRRSKRRKNKAHSNSKPTLRLMPYQCPWCRSWHLGSETLR